MSRKIESIYRVPYRFCPVPCAITDDWLPHLTGSELKTYIALVRLTWGKRKPSDTLSISQISTITGQSRYTTSRNTATLHARGLLQITGATRHARTYEVQMPRIGVALQSNTANAGVALQGNTVLPQGATSIDIVDRAVPERRKAAR